jgi:hypothetical protein
MFKTLFSNGGKKWVIFFKIGGDARKITPFSNHITKKMISFSCNSHLSYQEIQVLSQTTGQG